MTYGWGVSMQISNNNKQCEMEKETQLCKILRIPFISPFQVFQNFTISGCVSKKPYRFRYCGVCSDECCCIPYKPKTIEVEFECNNKSVFTWKWVNASFCNISCRNPSDIFIKVLYID
uniref:CTCK domain-containing protein n=1 Tax=Electrophorus electricus TaxID=8005 RepID=A0A4W4EDK6_ELEEL